MITDNESEGFWSGFFDELIDRGLSGVELVISDGHKGIQAAVSSRFLGASWQMSLTSVSESFDEVETCARFISAGRCLTIFQTRIRKR